jgi:hypothetical protein
LCSEYGFNQLIKSIIHLYIGRGLRGPYIDAVPSFELTKDSKLVV